MTATHTSHVSGLSVDQILAVRSLGGAERPQWSPDGSQIAFVSSLGGAPELWSADASSGLLTRLTVGMGGVGHLATFLPQWSPDGTAIAYVSAKSGVDEIWLWHADGSADTQLTRLGARIEAFDWAPDGQTIAVTESTKSVMSRWDNHDNENRGRDTQPTVVPEVVGLSVPRARLKADRGMLPATTIVAIARAVSTGGKLVVLRIPHDRAVHSPEMEEDVCRSCMPAVVVSMSIRRASSPVCW